MLLNAQEILGTVHLPEYGNEFCVYSLALSPDSEAEH